MIEFRPAVFDDHTNIAKLHADNWRQFYRGILSDHYLNHEVEAERLTTWRERMKNPPENQYISLATSGDQLVGFCCIYLDDDPDFGTLIDNFHVCPDMQRSGIGKRLFRQSAQIILDHAKSKKLYLWVFESNKNARSVYEKLNGTLFETVNKKHEDGTVARVCRFTWPDASLFL